MTGDTGCPARSTLTWVNGIQPLPWITNTVFPSPNGWLTKSRGLLLTPVGSLFTGGGGSPTGNGLVDAECYGWSALDVSDEPRKAPAVTSAAAATASPAAARKVWSRRR